MRTALGVALLLLAVATPALGQSSRLTLPRGSRLPDPSEPCDCTDTPTTDAPVCGGDLVTYGNECVAKCANVLIINDGPCAPCELTSGDCQCGNTPYAPVCAFGLTFTDTCDADCGGYSCPQSPGVCFYNPNGTLIETGPAKSTRSVAEASADTELPAPASAKYDYTEGLHKTLIFFESMRSGELDRQRLAWRSDSCADCKGPAGEDVSGGYYEAGGSFLKLGLVEAFLVTMLGWSIDSFPAGFTKAGDMENALAATRWGADYLVNAHSAPNQFVAVVGNSTIDFAYYGPVEEGPVYRGNRLSCYINADQPGSEIAGEAAAGLAAAYVVLKDNSKGSAAQYEKYLTHAKQLYTFAITSPGSYQDATDPCLAQHGLLYKSTGYVDELAWAAAWLYKATGTASYLADAKKYYGQLAQPGYSFETGEKVPGLNVLMGEVDPDNAAEYQATAKQFFSLYLEQTIPHTPKGLAYPYHFGALRPATQAAMLALIEAKQLRAGSGSEPYAAQLFNYAKFQIDYVLGDSGRSWLVGYGEDYPDRLWHKLSYNSFIDWPLRGVEIFTNLTAQKTTGKYESLLTAQASKLDMEGSFTPQRFTAYGALFGAPLKDDNLVVSRKDFSYADGVTGITGALAALAEYFTAKQGPQTDCGLDLGWTHPNATVTAKSINNTAECAGLSPTITAPRPPAKTPTKAPAKRPTTRRTPTAAAGAGGAADEPAADSPVAEEPAADTPAGDGPATDGNAPDGAAPDAVGSPDTAGDAPAATGGDSPADGTPEASSGAPSTSTVGGATDGTTAPAPAPGGARPAAGSAAALAASVAAAVCLALAL